MEISRPRKNLCGQVEQDLGRGILAGQYMPGSVLPQEPALCEQLGVSRTVIREAIKSLAAKGLVQSRPKRGTIVQPARSWNYLDPDVLAWQSESDVGAEQLRHLTEFRRTLEPEAAALAAQRASEEQLVEIRDAWQAMADSVDDVGDFLKADQRFHTEILYATGNPFFAPVANIISVSLTSSLKTTNRDPDQNRTSVPVHEKVLKPILARNAARARTAMRRLLDDAAARIENAVG